MGCCCKKLGNGKAGNGAASLAPNPIVAPIYTTQAGSGCGSNGAMQANSPYLVSPDDYQNLPPLVSIPIISRLGRTSPNNSYVFTSPPPGVVQVQSPKVGRY